MNPAVIILNYLRYDLAAKTAAHNLPIAGYDYGLIVIDQYGLAKAMNIGLQKAIAAGYDTFMFMANDIYEPNGWLLKRILFLSENPECGICSIGFEEKQTPERTTIIGNYIIRKSVIDKIGGFDESFDPYGAIDLDFCNRVNKAGFQSWYLSGQPAKHTDGHGASDSGEVYGFSKPEMIAKTWDKYVQSTMASGYNIINQQQFNGE